MKVARLYRFGDIRIEEMDIPMPGDGDILIKTAACGICTGDVMPWYIEKKAPIVLGHEPAGVVVKVGKKVKNFVEGDRVFVHHHAPCLRCAYCRRGDYVQCRTWKRSRIIPGGMAEYILVPENNLKDTLKLPEGVTLEEATLVEPLACVVKSMRRSGMKKGDTVAVLGLGIMGVLHVAVARYYGAGRVIGIDRIDFRLRSALEQGAAEVINFEKIDVKDALRDLTDGKGPEIVIVGPGSTEAMKTALEIVSDGGNVVFFTPTPPDERLLLKPENLFFRDINIINSYSCGPDNTREALYLLKTGIVRADELITHRFTLEQTNLAYRKVSEAGDSLKVIVTMGN